MEAAGQEAVGQEAEAEAKKAEKKSGRIRFGQAGDNIPSGTAPWSSNNRMTSRFPSLNATREVQNASAQQRDTVDRPAVPVGPGRARCGGECGGGGGGDGGDGGDRSGPGGPRGGGAGGAGGGAGGGSGGGGGTEKVRHVGVGQAA
jgi:hypothetical protein